MIIIEAFVEKIVASPKGFDWYLRFGGGPDGPIRCKVEGKRLPNAHAVVLEGSSPPDHSGGTGRDQRGLRLISSSPFTGTRQDAQKYLYSDSTARRVHRWKGIQVNLYI